MSNGKSITFSADAMRLGTEKRKREAAEARVTAVEQERDEIAIRCADDVASAERRIAELEGALQRIRDWAYTPAWDPTEVAREALDARLIDTNYQDAEKGQRAE